MASPDRRFLGIRLTGRVQGVGFRWWTRQRATELGLRGTVRNAADGSVEVGVAGPPEAVAAFREALARGPAGAVVRGVEELDPPGEDDLPPDFRIVP